MIKKSQITSRRLDLRVSQIELAKLACISRYRLSMFECGHLCLTPAEEGLVLDTLDKIEVAKEQYEKSRKDLGGSK